MPGDWEFYLTFGIPVGLAFGWLLWAVIRGDRD